MYSLLYPIGLVDGKLCLSYEFRVASDSLSFNTPFPPHVIRTQVSAFAASFHPSILDNTVYWPNEIITGANVGLGLEASRHFVRFNAAKVVLAVRSLDKGEAVKKSSEESENRQNVVGVWKLDLANYHSVIDFAERAESLDGLDVVVEKAGIVTSKFTMMEENGSSITTNVVSPFSLAFRTCQSCVTRPSSSKSCLGACPEA